MWAYLECLSYKALVKELWDSLGWVFCLIAGNNSAFHVHLLQVSKINDLFTDKELDGYLFPVLYITVQFICVHTWEVIIQCLTDGNTC